MSYYGIKLQLNDHQNYQGLGLIAILSLFTMPMGLEVIFSHRDLWFEQSNLWQSVLVDWCWRIWVIFGVICLSTWNAATELPYVFEKDQWKLRWIFGLISFLVFLISSLPSFYWMMKMNLCGVLELMLKLINAVIILGGTMISTLVLQHYLSISSNILISIAIGSLMLWLVI